MGKINRIKYIIAAILALFVFALTNIMLGGVGMKTYAATTSNSYSSVIDDLTKDRNFNFADYPENILDYSLKVIQISESEDGELFVYVYQPSVKAFDMTLRTIRLSTSYDDDVWKDYGLTRLSSWGTLIKYLVDGFTVSTASVRYYNITAVHRDYIRYVDSGSLSSLNGIAVEVAQCWTAETLNGVTTYSMETIDVITITDCMYGSIRVPAGFNFVYSFASDMHIIAFNTDIEIEKLLEADVAFKYRTVDKGLYGTDYGDWQPKEVTVTYMEKGSTDDHIFGEPVHTWDKIQSSSEFINTCAQFGIELSSEVKNDIKSKKWVLAYWDTEFQNDTGGVFGVFMWIGAAVGLSYNHYTEVSDATVIRLEFIKDGEVYNLGVVSNKSGVTEVIGGGDKTFADYAKDKIASFFDDVWDKICNFFKDTFGGLSWWQWVLIIVALVVGLPLILSILFPAVANVVLTVLKTVGKALWWLICLPFRALKKLFGKGA